MKTIPWSWRLWLLVAGAVIVGTINTLNTLSFIGKTVEPASITEQRPELQQRLIDADLGLTDDHFSYHATDLYVVVFPGVFGWLEKNYEHVRNVTKFRSPADSEWLGAGKMCLDIPFAGNWPEDPNKLSKIEQLKVALRENRIKHGIDYAVVHKQGVTQILCNDVYKQEIADTAKKLGLEIFKFHTY